MSNLKSTTNLIEYNICSKMNSIYKKEKKTNSESLVWIASAIFSSDIEDG